MQDLNPRLPGFKAGADPLPQLSTRGWGGMSMPGVPVSDISAHWTQQVETSAGQDPTPQPTERRAQHRAMTFGSRPLDLSLSCPYPHLPAT